MSKISLEPNASGAGTFTLAAPNSDTNRTLTLPDASGSIVAADASTGRFDSSNMPAGSVLQVVQASTTTEVSLTSTSFQDSNLTGSITPSSASSKILVIVSQGVRFDAFTNNRRDAFVRLLRNSTELFNRASIVATSGTDSIGRWICMNTESIVYLDSPSTTSALTYKTQYRINNAANSTELILQQLQSISTITLMEIAG